ncbi:MAG: biopolymer transporter ExbD [Crocinitomicaceae bacterium]|nr:biopolymer transporter ExbD [Crocinitomicaceae bacterium]
MAEIVEGGGGGGKHGKKKAKKPIPRMDMTPMVDLAFLLLTFFILATSLSKPKTLEIIYPKEVKDADKTTPLQADLATTLLLGEEDNQVFYFFGKFKPDTTVLIHSDFSKDGMRKVLLDRNKRINEQVEALKVKKTELDLPDSTYKRLYSEIVNDSLAPFVIVKTIPKSKYRNVVNAMDELNITNVRKRAIMDMAESEHIAMRQRIDELGLK